MSNVENESISPENWSPSFAAWYVSSRLGDNEVIWGYRLSNWRQPGRRPKDRPSVVPKVNAAGAAVYTKNALDDFIGQVIAYNERQSKFCPPNEVRTTASAHIDGVDQPHIRVMFCTGSVSRAGYEIDAAAARRLAKKLLDAAHLVESVTPASNQVGAA